MNNLYTLSLDSIKYILGLIRDTVDLPANILDDLHIQSTTTYSSYRLDTLLKALKEENIQYCDEAISKLNKLSKEIITDKLQITNENTIYLLLTDPVNNVYEQWLLINGTPQMIGTTEMKLDSVYTKDEADARYALLADFNTLTTSFNNLATTVDKKIDKDKIVTVLDDSVTDEQVPSAKAVQEELDKKIEGDNVVKKDDIVAVLNDSVTDEQVPSAKVVYDNAIKNKNLKTFTTFEQLGITIGSETLTSIVEAMPDNSIAILNINANCNTIYPQQYGTLYISRVDSGRVFIRFETSPDRDNFRCQEWVSSYGRGAVNTWREVCTTTVKDVGVTDISMNSNYTTNANCKYQVVNGICYINFIGGSYKLSGTVNNVILASGLPIPRVGLVYTTYVPWASYDASKQVVLLINQNGELTLHAPVDSNNCAMLCSFSYPVAE